VNAAAKGASPGHRNLWPLWGMIVIFALPALAAWFFYFNPGLLPSTRVNRGELIEPARPWPADLRLANADGSPFDPSALRDRWTMLLVSQAPCGPACEQKLAELRQIRLALGESRYVVERMALLAGDPGAPLGAEYAGTTLARADRAAESALQTLLGPEPPVWDRVYIVDPFGNLMMRYAADAPPKDVLKDMERLLKASKTWIKGAQYGHR
jgi:hypothetical protein